MEREAGRSELEARIQDLMAREWGMVKVRETMKDSCYVCRQHNCPTIMPTNQVMVYLNPSHVPANPQELSAREGSVQGTETWLMKLEEHARAKETELKDKDRELRELQKVG